MVGVYDLAIHSVRSEAFGRYGKVVEGFDPGSTLATTEVHLEMPAEGVVYKASLDFLEVIPELHDLGCGLFGDWDVEIGWCIGYNRKLNALEYHKSIEVIVALTDIALMVGVVGDIHYNGAGSGPAYSSEALEVFTLSKGTVVELFPGTLHFAPLHLGPEGFAALIMLPRGTNDPLSPEIDRYRKDRTGRPRLFAEDKEFDLLWMKNKWMICHPDSPQARRGAWAGITGPNVELPFHLVTPF